MAVENFLRIGDIKGESRDDRHRDEIEVLSWSWGMTQSVSGSGAAGGAGKTSFTDISFTHLLDRASPSLMKACATGQHIRDATLSARKAGQAQQDYLIVKMSDVIITSVLTSGGRDDTSTIESVSLKFGKVDLEYRSQKPDGSLETGNRFGFDLTTNRIT
jgi:type VI secretion system secreted protein Hcp